MPLLDWLRFGAALMVVLKHAKDQSFVGYLALPAAEHSSLLVKLLFGATRFGEQAVLVFFVLSGFLVGGATIKRIRTGIFDLRGYAADRVSRILLPLIPAIGITTLVHFLSGAHVDLERLAVTLLCLQGTITPGIEGNAPLWTLSYEVWFYILNGALAFMIAKQTTKLSMLVLLAAAVVFANLKLEYLASWYLGAAAFAMRPLKRTPWSMGVSAAILIAATGLVEFTLRPGHEQYHAMGTLVFSVSSVFFITQLAQTVNDREGFGHRAAAFSYSLYLIHYPILCLIALVFPPSPRVDGLSFFLLVARVVVCILGGMGFYLGVDKHATGTPLAG